MIDLSYLTSEEREKILAVLKRDANLKKADELRVKKLETSVHDRTQLKYMTGEWFYETKSQRHHDRIHGSDIIQASMNKEKPVTILELSQSYSEKPSMVNSANLEVFIPPELSGLIQEPSPQPRLKRNEHNTLTAPQPQTKERQNPFNSGPLRQDPSCGTDQKLLNGAQKPKNTPEKELLLLEESFITPLTNLSSESCDSFQVTPNFPAPENVLLKQKMYSSHESLLENRAHAPRLPPPKGILKLTSSYSSCDSLPVRRNSGQLLDPLSPPDSPSSLFSSGDWLERKQVRFSSVVTGINNVVDDDDDNEAGDHDSFLPSEDSSNGFIHEDDNDRLTEENEVALDCPVAAHFSPGSLFCDNGPADREDVKSGERENSRGGSDMKIPDELSAGAFNDQHENHHADPPIIQVSDVHGAVSGRGNIEDASPARRAMKKLSPRPLSLSKSLEDITKVPALSATPISPTSTFLNPEQMKMMSTSVPSSLQEQSNGRFPPENSFHADRQKAMNSSQTNISCSSGMASMSSASGSVMSIYMGDYGNVEVRGTIRFAMNYVEKIGEFHICVVQCKDLAVAEPKRNRSDPYVKCYLMPDKTKLGKRKTSVKKKTLNPTYNEILKYKIAMETLKTQTLNLSVWHNDTFGRNSFLGEVDIDLSKWSFSNTQMKDFVLKARPAAHFKPTDHRGEVRVALRFLPGVSQSKSLPKMGEIQIWVKECRNLPAVRGVIDPFIKCAVLPDTSRKSRQKTRVVKKSANPAFNHTMVYNGFGAEDLQETCVELTVWDHDRLNNHFLGGLRLGLGTGKSYGSDVDWMDSNPDERTMWDRMMESPNEWVEDVLPLRMLMMARSMSK